MPRARTLVSAFSRQEKPHGEKESRSLPGNAVQRCYHVAYSTLFHQGYTVKEDAQIEGASTRMLCKAYDALVWKGAIPNFNSQQS